MEIQLLPPPDQKRKRFYIMTFKVDLQDYLETIEPIFREILEEHKITRSEIIRSLMYRFLDCYLNTRNLEVCLNGRE